MLASSWNDIVIGIDIHFEMVVIPPAPPVPTPLPNPFVGMVDDPIGLAIGRGLAAVIALATGGTPTGPVTINFCIATNVGTNAKGSGHMLLPPGVSWAPIPKFPMLRPKGGPPPLPGLPVAPENDAMSIQGSLTVNVMGSSAVRFGEMWMSCGEPLRLPSSVVIAIPKGMPVLIGGPPAISLLDALLGAIRTKWVAGFLDALISHIPFARLRNLLSKAACFLTGHPVDVATGRMMTDNVDFELPGPLPLRFERTYFSSWAHRDGPLGAGWSHSLDQAVWAERGKLVYLAEDGREIEFDVFDFSDHMLAPGQEVYDPLNQLTLRFKARDLIEIEAHDGERLEFAPPQHRGSGPRAHWWRILRRRNRAGNEIQFSYDDRGNLQWVRDSGGRVIGFEHNDQRRLVRVLLPHPSQDGFIDYLRYTYDAAGDLVAVTDALGASWTYAYKQHLMVRETNRNGLAFYFAYDGWSSDAYCVRTWGDGGIYDHVLDYAKGVQTVVTNSLGFSTIYKLNPIGQVIEIVDARGSTTKYEYDPRTLKTTKLTSPSGGEFVTEYDAQGNPSKIVRPDGGELLLEHDARNHLVRAVDVMGREWRWDYDGAGRHVARIDPLNQRVQFHWGETGLIAFTDAAGQHTQFRHDAAGNLTSLTYPSGATIAWTFDRLGRLLSEIDPNGNADIRYRDALGRLVRLDEADGNVHQLTRDPEGNVLTARDQHNDVRFEYQGMNRLAARTQANTRVEFIYDSEEHLLGLRNQHGLVYRFVLDEVGATIEEHGFDQLRRSYVRDPSGRATRILRPGNRETDLAYDELGRLTSATHHDGTKTIYAYDKAGELLQAENDAIKLAFEYDALGRLIKEWQGVEWVESAYDALGSRTQIRSSKGLSEHIHRDANGQVTRVEAIVPGAPPADGSPATSSTFQARFERDQLGQELQRSLPGGVQARWQRDRLGRPVQHEIWSEHASPDVRAYHWESNERLQRITDSMRGPVNHTYDGLGALSHSTHADGRIDLRMPDAVGNLFKTPDRSDRRYGPSGELLENRGPKGTTRYFYDAEGNLAKKIEPDGNTWTFEFDPSGKLRKVVRPNGESVQFEYDALGRRIAKIQRGKTTRWIWDGNFPLHEWVDRTTNEPDAAPPPQVAAYDGQKALEALLVARPAVGPPSALSPQQVAAAREGTADAPITWLFEPDSFAPLAKLVGSERFGIVTDHLGAPLRMFDASGVEVWSADLDTYGELHHLRGDRSACPFRFAGQYEDSETGLYYNRHRYYDPDVGTYISQDPLRLAGGPALYAYVRDPVLLGDPFGLVGVPGLPNTPGIYIITNPNTNEGYVGQAGLGERGMAQRVGGADHLKAQELLAKEGTVVEFIEVDLKDAAAGSERNNILRFFEQRELDKLVERDIKVLNDMERRIQALKKGPKAEALIEKHGVEEKPKQTCVG